MKTLKQWIEVYKQDGFGPSSPEFVFYLENLLSSVQTEAFRFGGGSKAITPIDMRLLAMKFEETSKRLEDIATELSKIPNSHIVIPKVKP